MFDTVSFLEDTTTPLLSLEPGRIVALDGAPGTGLTRLALTLLAEPSRTAPVACVDVRGWLHPPAAWEVGIDPDRLIIVRNRDRLQWPGVTAALIEGLAAVYAEVPGRVPDQIVRRMAALARSRRTALILRPLSTPLPSGIAHLRVKAAGVTWEGTDAGHGRLSKRSLLIEVSGKSLPEQMVEVDDDGRVTARVASGDRLLSSGRSETNTVGGNGPLRRQASA
jgi:hypothetical protein